MDEIKINYEKVSDNKKVIELIKQREAIEKEIRNIDEMAIVRYELEILGINDENVIYIVTAYRWGNRENHSYNIGVFSEKHKAQQAADSHCEYRGGKYACVVDMCTMNLFDNDFDEYTTEIYRAKSCRD